MEIYGPKREVLTGRNIPTGTSTFLPYFITHHKYCENEWRIREERGLDPFYFITFSLKNLSRGERSGARTVDENSENPRVKPKPQTPPRVVKRARYQAFEDEFIPEDYHVALNLRTVTYISDDEGNNRTFITVIEEN